jgi:hypothetical protein
MVVPETHAPEASKNRISRGIRVFFIQNPRGATSGKMKSIPSPGGRCSRYINPLA